MFSIVLLDNLVVFQDRDICILMRFLVWGWFVSLGNYENCEWFVLYVEVMDGGDDMNYSVLVVM